MFSDWGNINQWLGLSLSASWIWPNSEIAVLLVQEQNKGIPGRVKLCAKGGRVLFWPSCIYLVVWKKNGNMTANPDSEHLALVKGECKRAGRNREAQVPNQMVHPSGFIQFSRTVLFISNIKIMFVACTKQFMVIRRLQVRGFHTPAPSFFGLNSIKVVLTNLHLLIGLTPNLWTIAVCWWYWAHWKYNFPSSLCLEWNLRSRTLVLFTTL